MLWSCMASCFSMSLKDNRQRSLHVHSQWFLWLTNQVLKAVFNYYPNVWILTSSHFSLSPSSWCLWVVFLYPFTHCHELCIRCLHHSLQNGNTPFIAASQEGHKDIVEVLLNHGAEVDLPRKVSVCVRYSYLNFHAVWYYRQSVTIPLDSSC